jgi:hypothetical protein
MEYQIYKTIFLFVCFLVYLTFTGPMLLIVNYFVKLSIGITGLFYVGIYVLSTFQSKQAVDIYYATEMKFWRAVYLSFYEFWGMVFLKFRGSKKEQPDKLKIEEETLNTHDLDKL